MSTTPSMENEMYSITEREDRLRDQFKAAKLNSYEYKTILIKLGDILLKQNKHYEAITLYEEAMAAASNAGASTSTAPEEDDDDGSCTYDPTIPVYNIASIHTILGKRSKGIELMTKLVDEGLIVNGRRVAFGVEKTTYGAYVLNEIGIYHSDVLRDFKKATYYFRLSIEMCMRHEVYDVTMPLMALVNTLMEAGNSDDAKAWLRVVINGDFSYTNIGDSEVVEYPDYVFENSCGSVSLHGPKVIELLAMFELRENNIDESQKLMERAVKMCDREWTTTDIPPEHDITRFVYSLCDLYESNGDKLRSTALLRRFVFGKDAAKFVKLPPKEDDKICDYVESMFLSEMPLIAREKPDSVLIYLSNIYYEMGFALYDSGMTYEAEVMFQHALRRVMNRIDARDATPKPRDRRTLAVDERDATTLAPRDKLALVVNERDIVVLHGIANVYAGMGNNEKAMFLLSEASKIAEDNKMCAESAKIARDMGHMYMVMDNPKVAEVHLRSAYETMSKNCGKLSSYANRSMLSLMRDFSNVLMTLEKFDEAENLLRLSIGAMHPIDADDCDVDVELGIFFKNNESWCPDKNTFDMDIMYDIMMLANDLMHARAEAFDEITRAKLNHVESEWEQMSRTVIEDGIASKQDTEDDEVTLIDNNSFTDVAERTDEISLNA